MAGPLDVVATLYGAGARLGLPATLLIDNACIYTASYRGGYSAIESELFHPGITYKHSRPRCRGVENRPMSPMTAMNVAAVVTLGKLLDAGLSPRMRTMAKAFPVTSRHT